MTASDDSIMSRQEGLAAMYDFLYAYWKRSESEELAILLGSLKMLSDDRPADAALWDDWCNSVERTLLARRSTYPPKSIRKII
jgi:hypothetical protein